MARDHWQKIKLLKLLELLKQESDELHPMTTSQICKRMKDMDIPCDRRTLSVDAKILIDAAHAATFITERKTEELTSKLAELTGSHIADVLDSNMVFFNTKKHTNESIYYNMDSIESAVQEKKKVIFRYFDIDGSAQRAYSRDGHHYVAEPVAPVFNEDNYYLVSYSPRHDNTANYRIDRIDSVKVIEEDMCERALELCAEVSEYMDYAFKMHEGPVTSAVLEFDASLIGVVYDKFGETTPDDACRR